MSQDNNHQKRNITGSYPGVTGSYNSPKRQQQREFTTPESDTSRITPRYDFNKKVQSQSTSEPTIVQKPAQVQKPVTPEIDSTRIDTPAIKPNNAPPKSETVKKELSPTPEKKDKFDFKGWFSKQTVKRFLWQLAFYVSILIVSILLTMGIVTVANDVFAFVKDDNTVVVTLKKGSSTDTVAKTLEKSGVIDHPSVFKFYSKLRHADGKYQYGDYTLNSNLGYDQIIATLQKPAVLAETVSITVHTGCTQDEFVAMLTSKKYYTAAELENALNNYEYKDFAWVQKLAERRCRLEGYIMPGTYEFSQGESAVTLVTKVLERFEETVLTTENKKLIKKTKLSTDEVITFASVLQKECSNPVMYKAAAAVIYNRLNAKVPVNLQLVSPINYALAVPKTTLTVDDKRTDSDYNTYKHVGLPIGPICTPSFEAISAVLTPDVSTNMYFISDGDNYYFAADAVTHAENLKKVSSSAKGTDTIR